MKSNYRFIEDPGHGWLEVPVADLNELGIASNITNCSYISRARDMAYLEEDCDLATFCNALRAQLGDLFTSPNDWFERHVTDVYQENTFVRNLPHYSQDA